MKKTLLAAGAALLMSTSMHVGASFAQTQGVSDTEIVLGAHHDLSGPFSAFSVPAVKAVEHYFAQINAEGGIHGRKLRYVVEDHGYNVSKVGPAVNKLINKDKIFAMFMALGTPHNLAAFKVQDPKGIPNVQPLTASPKMLDEPFKLHFAGTASYDDSIRAGVKYLHGEQASKGICSMIMPTDFGLPSRDGAKAEAEALGVKFVSETQHRPDELDFVGALQKHKEAGCDTIVVALTPKGIITAVATAKKIGWPEARFLTAAAGFHTVISKVPGGVTEGLYAAASWQDLETLAGDADVAAWIGSFKKDVGEKLLGTGAVLGRSGAELMVRALQAAGKDLTHESFLAAMESMDYMDKIMGVQVKLAADDHLAASSIFVSQVQGGSWKTLKQVR